LSRFVRERTSGLLFRLPVGGRKLDTNVKLLLIAGIVALVIGVGLTIFYFSLAYFFAVNARAVDTFAKNQRVAENGSENAEVAAVTDKKRGAGA
jgi:Na+-transporting methylmalonyl-CoA/oxaloacetate decarboxylase gamma subunit